MYGGPARRTSLEPWDRGDGPARERPGCTRTSSALWAGESVTMTVRGRTHMIRARSSPAFTLIELLVVVAVVALLIGILLPALSRAREQSRAAVCLSNVKQIALAFQLYAQEYGAIPGTYWQGAINLDWGGRNNAEYNRNPRAYSHPFDASVLRRYAGEVNRILECPTGQREANTFYDYTVIIRLAGVRVDVPWYMTYREDPSRSDSIDVRFPAIPLLIEEDFFFYNQANDDGSFANLDQFGDRHHGSGSIGYLNGSAGRFRPPKGGGAEIEEPRDLTCRGLKLWANGRSYEVWRSNAREFGWANRPK
jgi:prepilin-type N-terminal cleavage/methylation domain-containing protein